MYPQALGDIVFIRQIQLLTLCICSALNNCIHFYLYNFVKNEEIFLRCYIRCRRYKNSHPQEMQVESTWLWMYYISIKCFLLSPLIPNNVSSSPPNTIQLKSSFCWNPRLNSLAPLTEYDHFLPLKAHQSSLWILPLNGISWPYWTPADVKQANSFLFQKAEGCIFFDLRVYGTHNIWKCCFRMWHNRELYV